VPSAFPVLDMCITRREKSPLESASPAAIIALAQMPL